MTTQINKSVAGNSAHVGWVMWWTLEQKSMFLLDIQQSAANEDIPGRVQSRIRGKTAKNAWRMATSLPAKGEHSGSVPEDGDNTRSRYYTRTANENCRLIVRETLNAKLEVVDLDTVASIYFVNGDFTHSLQNSGISNSEINAQVSKIIRQMQAKFNDAIGVVDDAKIRELVIDWLHSVHRVCVRGTGGVYFIPRPTDSNQAAQVEQEIVNMTKWISAQPIGGLFSVIEVSKTGATNLDALAESAIEEIKSELESMHNDLGKWAGNAKMNAGSRMYSASTILEKISGIGDKYENLRNSLGDKMIVLESMIEVVRNRAMGMQTESATSIEESRKQKDADTYGDIEIEIPGATSKKQTSRKGKKAGITK